MKEDEILFYIQLGRKRHSCHLSVSQDVSPRMWARWTLYSLFFFKLGQLNLLYNGLTNMTQSNTLTTTWKKRLDVVIEVGKDHHHPK